MRDFGNRFTVYGREILSLDPTLSFNSLFVPDLRYQVRVG